MKNESRFDNLIFLLITLVLCAGLILTVCNARAMESETTNEVLEVKLEPIELTPDSKPVENIKTTTYFKVPLSEDLQDHIFKLCEQRNVDPAIIIAMIDKESKFKASNMGDNGNSYGLMQIQPRWHKKRMNALGCNNLLDPYQNVTVGINYFADLCDEGKSIEWALMAYNGGPAYANKNISKGVISDYASIVLNNSKKLERE